MLHVYNWQVRVPFSSFRPVKPDDPPLDPFLVHTLTIRFEPRRQVCPFPECKIREQICFICFVDFPLALLVVPDL